MKRSDNDALLRAANHPSLKMKTVPLIGVLSLLASAAFGPTLCVAAEGEGVALAIVYDTSGSMKDNITDANGQSSPKYVIANRALSAIARRIQSFATNDPSRKVEAGLFVFSGADARQAIPFGAFDAAAFENWAQTFSNPHGNTPLGNALNSAAQAVLKSPLPRKHVLVITDGQNTAGPQPSTVMPKLKEQSQAKQTTLSIHFVAFDIDAKIFEPIKKLGATVVSAANEAQLNTQLQYILQRKILLEEEEPPKK
jgi:hypothetical protein